MSTTATTNTMTAFEGARFMLKLADQGMTFTELSAKLGGRPTTEAVAEMAATFRSESCAVRFLEWAQS